MRRSAAHESRATRRGVTLIEMMIVVAIVGILAAVFLRVFQGAGEQGQMAATKAILVKLQKALEKRSEWFAQWAPDYTRPTYLAQFPMAFDGELGNANLAVPANWGRWTADLEFSNGEMEAAACLHLIVLGARVPPSPANFEGVTLRASPAILTAERFTSEDIADTEQQLVLHQDNAGVAGPVIHQQALRVFVDAWGSPIAIVNHGSDANPIPEVISAGPDRAFGDSDAAATPEEQQQVHDNVSSRDIR